MDTTNETTPTPRLLRRSRNERMLVGVCGGIAEYARVDANVVRIVVAVLTFFGGAGAFLYAVGWLLMPDDGEDTSVAARAIGRWQRR